MVEKLKFKNSFFTLLIIIASFFMSVGYASINSIVLDLEAKVSIVTPKKLFISNVTVSSEENGFGKVNLYEETYFSSTTTLSPTDSNAYVTYEITVNNSTPYTYGYADAKYILGENTYDNENIVFEISGITTETELESGESITFSITFKYNDLTNITNNTLNSNINFIFKNLSAMQLSSLIKINESQLGDSGLLAYNDKYYFVGSNVNNYIWYNCQDGYTSGEEYCEKWRIISIEEDEGVKIVKDDVVSLDTIKALETETSFWKTNTSEWMTNTKILAAGKVIFDPKGRRPINQSLANSYCINTNNGCNAYASNQNTVGNYKNLNVDADSLVKLYLENIYYTHALSNQAKSQLQEYSFPIGLVGVGINLETIINNEKSVTVNSNVGLLNPSDYIIISNDSNCQTEFTRYYNSSCRTNNWLPLTDKQHIMMNGKMLSTDDKNAQIWTIRNDGSIYSQDANNEFYLRPVVVLDKSVQAIGLGTSNEEDYYILIP